MNNNEHQTIEANQRSHQLELQDPSNSYHGFNFNLPRERPQAIKVSIFECESGLECPGSPILINASTTQSNHQERERQTVSVNPNNIIDFLRENDHVDTGHLVIDTNDICNAECIYCPNPRSSKTISIDQFTQLVNSTLRSIDVFQFGCGQEPTMDHRLEDFLRILNRSTLQPGKICMITNAMLLQNHNISKLLELGLSEIQVLIDTMNPEINNLLRRKTDIKRIVNNLRTLRMNHPRLSIRFACTVSLFNIAGIADLVRFGEEVNATFIFREVWDFTDESLTPRDDNYFEWIKLLALKEGGFNEPEKSLRNHNCYQKMEFYPSTSQQYAKGAVE